MQKSRLASLLLLVAVVSTALLSTSLAFAQTATNSTGIDVSGVPPVTAGVFKWFVGVIFAGVGYAVAASKGEKFDPINFGSTILIGIVLAVLTTAGGLSPITALAIVGILTPILDKVLGKKSATAQKAETK